MVENATADESSTRQAIKGYLRRHCFVCGCGLLIFIRNFFCTAVDLTVVQFSLIVIK